MKTKTLSFAIIAALLVVSVLAVSQFEIAEAKKSPNKFWAKINAEQQVLDGVPDPTLWDDVIAKGDAKFKLSKDGTELKYKIKIKNIENVVGVHIHNGAPGMNHHDHLVDIIPTDLTNPINQKGKYFMLKGVITDDDVLPMGGHGHGGGGHMERTLADLIDAMSNSHAYIQVHTSSDADSSTNTGPGDLYTPGEVRGNIYPGKK